MTQKLNHRAVKAIYVLLAAVSLPANADWSGRLAVGVAQTNIREFNDGALIVKEIGWLPGIEAGVAYQTQAWQAFSRGSFYSGAIAHQGQIQNGQPFNSGTGTALLKWQLGARRQIFGYWIGVAVEHDRWQRNIVGRNQVIGLDEITSSDRVSIAGSRSWSTTVGDVNTELGVYRAGPERLQVNFNGALDSVALKTRSATGYRAAAQFIPQAYKSFEFGVTIDRIRIARSESVSVTKNRSVQGVINQPEHLRRNVSFTVGYRF